MMRKSFSQPLICGLLVCLIATSCQPITCSLEPAICYAPEPRIIEGLPNAFPKLTHEERAQNWGRELYLGKCFAREMDFYRAITCFKSALFLIPRNAAERRLEIEYDIFLAYYSAGKYQEAVETFEKSRLGEVTEDFPAINDLRITLYDAYIQTCQPERACRILASIAQEDEDTANKLLLGTAIVDADFLSIAQAAECHPENESACQLLTCYQSGAKSIKKAQTLNAILPGAGYYYVGQKKSAVTSFIINALFIAASYQLFQRGYIPAAIITTSLEMGWYLGGINGAGLEAKQYNECLYSRIGRETMQQERLFPILMIQKGF